MKKEHIESPYVPMTKFRNVINPPASDRMKRIDLAEDTVQGNTKLQQPPRKRNPKSSTITAASHIQWCPFFQQTATPDLLLGLARINSEGDRARR